MHRLGTKGALVLLSSMVAALALGDMACGSESGDDQPGDTPDGGAFVDPDGSLDSTFSESGNQETGNDTGVIPTPDTCGGQPCAAYTGPKDFSDPNAPANAATLFGGGHLNSNGTTPAKEPGITYPNHETMFPINVSHIHHEWTSGASNDLFRLTFVGPNTTVTVYTSTPSWEPTDEQWDWIAESNRGASVQLTVAALNVAAPQEVWQSKTITLYYSALEVEGALYYWSTGSAGIMKAHVSDRIPEKFYTDPKATDANTCVACHTFSRDGKRLAVNYGGEKLKEVSAPDRVAIVPATGNPTRAGGWSTFSPDGKLILLASNGVLTLLDADTGATVGANNGIVPLAGKFATHPDWSALGDKVVISLANAATKNKDMAGGSIAILPYNSGTWGTPQIIVQAGTAPDNNFFPVFSPDSKWIAYVNAQGTSKDEKTAVLKLVPTAGGTPIEMVRLNHRVNNVDNTTLVGDSMPTWAPSTKPGVFWLAFSSVRAYGTLRLASDRLDQLWIAAVDPNQSDPAYSAFWAPFQNMPEGNHRAYWTHDTTAEAQCRCSEICGDSIDNDCDGTADESDCQTCQATEICNNGIDDNCDCAIDNCPATDPDPVIK